MGERNTFVPVKLFCGVIYAQESRYIETREHFQEKYSSIDCESNLFPFTQTDYYRKEMGGFLFRRFFSFSRLIDPSRLPEIKIASNQWEMDLSEAGHRSVNVDPGFLSNSNLIIATTKNHYHRVPLQEGVYAHIEYIFKHKRIFPLEWTYPDFRSPEYIDFFSRMQQLYKKNQLSRT